MRELLEFLFTQIGQDRIFVSEPVDTVVQGLKTDFMDMHNIKHVSDVKMSIVDNFRMLYNQNGMERRYAFSTLIGNTVNLVTDEIILDMKAYFNDGLALLTPDPYYLAEKKFTRESFYKYVEKIQTWNSKTKIKKRAEILATFKTVIGFYVYVNMNNEADLLDLSRITCTLYKDTEREKAFTLVKSIMKDKHSDTFLCSTYDEDDTTDHFWYMDKNTHFLGSVNTKIANYLGHWDFKVLPGTFDLFAVQTNGKTLIYSYENNIVYNEYDLEFTILNVLNQDPIDYHSRTLILLHNNDLDREGQEDILAFSPLVYKKEEEKGKYIELPALNIRSFKQIYGLDVLYIVTDNPDYVKEEEIPVEKMDENVEDIPDTYNDNNLPYVMTLMYMEGEEFTLKEIPCSSMPSSIHVNKDNGVVTLTFKQDVFYNVVTFFHEYSTLYKYSYMEISTSGVESKIQRKITSKKMEHLKRHLIETSLTEKTVEQEFNQMHNFLKVRVLEQKTLEDPSKQNPILSSSYFVDMTNNKPNFDIERLFINGVGRFFDFKFVNNDTKIRMRKELTREEIENTEKIYKQEMEWLKNNKFDKSLR